MFRDNKKVASLYVYKDNWGQNGSFLRIVVGRWGDIPGYEFKGVIFFSGKGKIRQKDQECF